MERGLIDVTAEGEWKPRKAREYRLTFVTSGAPPYTNPATNDYLRWQKIGADTVSAETPQSADTVSAEARIAADTVSASRPQNPQKCVNGPKFPADTVSSLIVKPYQGPFKRGPLNGLKYPSPDLDGLRSEVKEFLSGRTTADAELLAGWAGLPIDRLSAFLMGEGLSDQQQQSLPVALGVMLEPTDLQCGIGDLREWVREVIASLPYGGARELAQDAAVPEPILSRFRNGKGLPNEYRASLQHACARHIPFNQRTRRDV